MGSKKAVRLVKKPASPGVRMGQIMNSVMPQVTKVLMQHQDLRNLATEGWSSRNKPKFPRFINKRSLRRTEFGVRVVAPNAKKASISVYRMLNNKRHGNKATRVRKVLLSRGYQRKTIPRRFGNFGAGGSVVGMRSKKSIKVNKKGIIAGEWDEIANDTLRGDMTSGIKKGFKNGFRQLRS